MTETLKVSKGQLIILLGFYEPHRDQPHYVPADIAPEHAGSINALIERELIHAAPMPPGTAGYYVTDRGRAYLESLLRVPLPAGRTRWVTNYPASAEE